MRGTLSTIGSGALKAICVVLFLLNTFAGIMAGVWLLSKGQWRLVLGGLLASLTMPYWWSIIALPGIGLTMLTVKIATSHKSKVLAAAVAFISGLYDSILIMTWVGGVLVFALVWASRSRGVLIPMLLGGYSVATSPLLYMATYEAPDNIRAYAIVLVSEIGYILMAIMTLFGVPLLYSLILFAFLLIIKSILVSALALWVSISQTKPWANDDRLY